MRMWGSMDTVMQPYSGGLTGAQSLEYIKYSSTLPRRGRRPVYGSYGHINEIGNLEDKVRRLESDKDSLLLQCNVLGEQVDAQMEKIHELEARLNEKGTRLDNAHEMLHTEGASRRALETHKLDLMAEISSLKLKLSTAEKHRKESDERFLAAQRQIENLQRRLNEKTVEVAELRARVKNGTIPGSYETSGGSEPGTLSRSIRLRQTYHGTFPGSRSNAEIGDGYREARTLDKERTIDRLRKKHAEVEKLKKAVEALAEANDEKDKSLDEMRKVLKRYKKLEEYLLSTQGKHVIEGMKQMDDEHSDSSRQTSGSSADSARDGRRPGPLRTDMLHPNATSTPVNLMPAVNENPSQPLTPPSTIASGRSSDHGSPNDRMTNEDAFFPRTPPASMRRRVEASSTLPKDLRPLSPKSSGQSLPRKKGFASFGKGFFKLRTGKWSESAPNLDMRDSEPSSDDEAGGEAEEEEMKDSMAQQYKVMASSQQEPREKKKAKGLRKFFGRLKKSGSQDLENDRLEDFKRSGLRATAGPRLGWSRDLKVQDLDIPFARWDSDRIAVWLHSIGLSLYIGNCKAFVKNGAQLLNASMYDLEKEIGIRNHYHRKKLYLAARAMAADSRDNMNELDHNWVTRWLDDIGLPQYKDQFSDARIDGRMLHSLTVEDLVGLKVTNALHHVSIKRGIQVLRMNDFQITVLQRRPGAYEGPLHDCPEQVMLWTNHRVMEWLRTIDLSEYASNLRGSGVHGGLMVLEPRFTAELFAALLSIPKDKTLLRRHLNTHFVGLIGNDMQVKKREFQQSTDYTPLTPSTKVKMGKRGLFKHKRTKSEQDMEEFVCPVNVQSPLGRDTWRGGSLRPTHRRNGSLPRNFENRKITPARDLDYTNDINMLTDLLSKDNFLDRVPTSDV